MIRDFAKDLVRYMPAQIVPAAVGFLSIPLITKSFPPHEYGYYSLVLASIAVLMTFAGWIPMAIIRFYAAFEERRKHDFIKTTLLLTAGSNLLIAGVAYVFIVFFREKIAPDLRVLFYIGLVCFLFDALFISLQYFLRARRAAGTFTFYAVGQNLINLGVIFIVVYVKLPVAALLFAKLIANILLLPSLFAALTRFQWKAIVGARCSVTIARDMSRYSFPLVIGNLAAWMLSLSDRYILQFFRGAQEVGIYSASYNIADKTVMFFINLFMFASGPIAMIIWEREGAQRSKEYTAQIARYFILTALPLCFLISMLARPLMGFLTTDAYSSGAGIIPYVVFGVLLFGLQGTYQSGFLFYKKTRMITLAVVVSGVVNIILNVLFVPQYGYQAAAVTTFISYLVLLTLMIVLSRRIFPWKYPLRSLLNSAVASSAGSLLMFAGMQYRGLSSFRSIAFMSFLYAAAYIAVLLLLKELTGKEVAEIKTLLGRKGRL